jgi:hypothetical protein
MNEGNTMMTKLLFCFTATFVLQGASLSEADKKVGLAQLERTRAAVIDATKGLTDAQWKFKPAPDRWSVAECLEHIVLVEGYLLDSTSKNVMKGPAPKPGRDLKSIDNLVLTGIADRSQKAKAPEPVTPKGQASPAETLNRFFKLRGETIAFLQSTPDLRDHVGDSPLGQPLDAYQFLLFISAHSDRHTKQILEVKADPNFPK